MTNIEKLREVFPRTIFIYQMQGDRTCAIMCSDEWLNAEYTELSPNKNGVKTERETVTEFADRCRECGREKILDKIKAEIIDEKDAAYADFDQYKVDYLGVDAEYVEDELPQDDFRYGMERAIEIIDKYKAQREAKE